MTADPVAVSAVLRIPLDRIDPGPNLRTDLGDLTQLATSLRTIGQQQPVTVERPDDGRWQLVDGHRRHAAARKAGLTHLDAIVRPSLNAAHRDVIQLAIQAGSKRFDPIAEGQALHSLMFDAGMTREQIAAAVGRSPIWVRDRIALTHLEPDEVRQVRAGRLTVGEALLRLAGRRAERTGETAAPQRPAPAPAAAPTSPPSGARLPVQQIAVLAAIAEGLERTEIAARLGIAVAGVKSHTTRAYAALGARNAAHAVHLAHLVGLLPITTTEAGGTGHHSRGEQ
ncbi:ParB/RepB/Spo0J family partition protein [Micromonospora sp. LOL_014]|uniref:ParB/RepB/Spo0J family partition protein n=1 Tax=Micromonospora sp. LOL_014 TaxID=3345415 RepID=UPI003A855573